MDCVLIGASDRSVLWRHGTVQEEEYPQFVKDYAQFLADHFENVIITPDDGVYTDVADEFARIKGKKAVAFYPDKDTYYGIEHIKKNFAKYDVRPIGGDWYTLNAELTKKAPIVICLGFTPGVLIEGSFIKYHQKYGGRKDASLKKISWFIDTRCIDVKLPASFEERIQNILYYKDMEELASLVLNRL